MFLSAIGRVPDSASVRIVPVSSEMGNPKNAYFYVNMGISQLKEALVQMT